MSDVALRQRVADADMDATPAMSAVELGVGTDPVAVTVATPEMSAVAPRSAEAEIVSAASPAVATLSALRACLVTDDVATPAVEAVACCWPPLLSWYSSYLIVLVSRTTTARTVLPPRL